MAATLTAVPIYVKSKVHLYFGENTLLSRVVNIPRSIVNMVLIFPIKNFVSQTYAWIWSKVWRYGSRPLKTEQSSPKEIEGGEGNESDAVRRDEYLRDFISTNISSTTIRSLYLYFLENNFLGITKESLELLRYDSKILQGVQDFEMRTVLQSLFGCLPEHNPCDTGTKYLPNAKKLFWESSSFLWNMLVNRITNLQMISWIIPERQNDSDQKVAISELSNQVDDNTQGCSHSTTSTLSLLMCEASHLPQVVTDSGTYALSSTHQLLKEAVLLFVPMEILENTTELLKHSSLSMSISPLNAFWQLFHYISIWGLDLMDDMCNQPEINYAVIDDEDFHFVVNVPKMRRPVLFVGIR